MTTRMTPEQARAHWTLAGLPLMPEWIEFCRGYLQVYKCPDKHSYSDLVSAWHNHVVGYYGRSFLMATPKAASTGWFTTPTKGHVAFEIGDAFYDWNIGEDDA